MIGNTLLFTALALWTIHACASSKHVFIGGYHYSGTTILAKLLSTPSFSSGLKTEGVNVRDVSQCTYRRSNSTCYAPENEGVFLTQLFNEYQQLTNSFCAYVDEFPNFSEWGLCTPIMRLDESHCRKMPLLFNGTTLQSLHQRLIRDWSPWWNMSKGYLIEKDIQNMIISPVLNCMFHSPAFVFVVRHPMGSCKFFRCNITRAMDAWLLANEILAIDALSLDKVAIVHYESMYTNLAQVVSGLETFLGWPSKSIAFRDYTSEAGTGVIEDVLPEFYQYLPNATRDTAHRKLFYTALDGDGKGW
jgi:hypothetical protein